MHIRTRGFLSVVAGAMMLMVGASASYAALADTPTVLFERYTGGDAGDGLTLTGDYLYTVDIGKQTAGNSSLQGYSFSPLSIAQPSGTPGAAISAVDFDYAAFELTNHGSTHSFDYGSSADDDAMESIMGSTVYGTATGTPSRPRNIAIGFDLTAGRTYELKLLIPNVDNHLLEWDVFIEGVGLPGTPFSTNNTDTTGNRDGTIVTSTFTLDDSSSHLDINVIQTSGAASLVTVGAATLKDITIPEPGSLALLGLGAMTMLRRRTGA